MEERLTYVVAADAENSAESIKVGKDSVLVADCGHDCYGIAADFQYRVTANVNELPVEIRDDLKPSDELHIRWFPRQYAFNRAPFSARLPSGLHVFHREQGSDGGVIDAGFSNICESLSRAFGDDLDCSNVFSSFSVLGPESSTPKTFQWHNGLESLSKLQAYLRGNLCGSDGQCRAKVAELASATYLDIDYDSADGTIMLTSVWTGLPDLARFPISAPKDGNRVEVGVFKHHDSTSASELKFGGFLIDVGVDEKPSGTLFDFPSRHHTTALAASISFERPTGLHPRLRIQFKPSQLESEACSLHGYFTLPSAIFIDRYQFSDPLSLASQNLIGLRSLTGEDDLEAPDWVVSRWGSAALFDLAVPEDSGKGWDVTIPMHLRYIAQGAHSNDTQFADLNVPHPVIFWACEETDPETSLSNNPFDRINLGYDGLFPSNTRFHHVEQVESEMAYEIIKVPILDKAADRWVPLGTFLAVVLGFVWICWRLLGSGGRYGGQEKTIKQKKRQ